MFHNYSQILIDEAQKAIDNNETPIASIALHNNQIIAITSNKVEMFKDKTAHAEMLLIKEMQKYFKATHFFDIDLSVYVTLEPCCMCMSALAMCGVRNVYYMLEDEKFGGIQRIFLSSSYYKPNCYYLYNESYHKMMQSFFQKKR